MPCGACGCRCYAGGEATAEQLLGATADLDNARRAEATIADMAFIRFAKFYTRGLLILLWVYLYNSMRKYAINYIGEDTWFSTFVVITVAVPVAEFFCIMGQIWVVPIPPPRSSPHVELG